MIKISVPATSANLGPGYDSFGLSYQLYNTFSIEERHNGKLTIRGVSRRYQGKSNLVYKAMLKVFNHVNYRPGGIYIHSQVNVPVSRGLGSSATCIVAGLIGANILSGSQLDEKTIFEMAVEMEQHPDNIVPAFYGGLTTATLIDGIPYYIKKQVSDTLAFHVIIPDFTVSTFEARKVLPKKLLHSDAAHNVAFATMSFEALQNGDVDILKHCMRDRLHEPYRRTLIHHYDIVTAFARSIGCINYCISGSGPTILIITEKTNTTFFDLMSEFLKENYKDWQLLTVNPDQNGVIVERD